MDDSDDLTLAQEVHNIVYSLARILELKGGSIRQLPPNDALMLALCGEILSKMTVIPIEVAEPQTYLPSLAQVIEENFAQHKEHWIQIMVANQDKVIGAFAGGMMK